MMNYFFKLVKTQSLRIIWAAWQHLTPFVVTNYEMALTANFSFSNKKLYPLSLQTAVDQRASVVGQEGLSSLLCASFSLEPLLQLLLLAEFGVIYFLNLVFIIVDNSQTLSLTQDHHVYDMSFL